MQLVSLLLLTAIAWLYFQQDLVDVITGAIRGLVGGIPPAQQHFLCCGWARWATSGKTRASISPQLY